MSRGALSNDVWLKSKMLGRVRQDNATGMGGKSSFNRQSPFSIFSIDRMHVLQGARPIVKSISHPARCSACYRSQWRIEAAITSYVLESAQCDASLRHEYGVDRNLPAVSRSILRGFGSKFLDVSVALLANRYRTISSARVEVTVTPGVDVVEDDASKVTAALPSMNSKKYGS
jgi:hypothetical protein